MQKTLYMIGGTMGVGKTTVCQILKKRLNRAVFLDGDWCWDADPFQVTEETKAMVTDNICYLLNSFLHASVYENIIFCWVMHEQAILDGLLSRLDTSQCRVKCISLVCSPEELERRLARDIASGKRQPEIIRRSLERLPLYESLNTLMADVSELTPEETADWLLRA